MGQDQNTQKHRISFREKLRRKGFMQNLRTLLRFVKDRSRENDLMEVTSTMALATLIAIVPVLALSLAAFSAFPGFADSRKALEDLIVMSFLPEQYSEQLLGYISEFTSHTAGLTTFGIAGLAVTAFLLIDKLFITLNRIFRVRSMRPWPQRALIYWALMTMGPLAMAVSITMTGHYAKLALAGVDPGISQSIYNLGQLCLQSLGFALIYKFVPNCRVHYAHALAGGFSVSLLGLIVKQIFGLYVTGGTLTNIYGAFVALPVLILWIYIAWYLFFAGAAVTATIPKLTAGRFLDSYRVGNDFLTGLVMLRELVGLRLAGKPPILSVEDLCDAADTYPEAANRILAMLQAAGYVAPVTNDNGGLTQNWVLVADTQKVGLLRAFEFFCVNGSNSLITSKVIKNSESAGGLLAPWWNRLQNADALTLTMAEIFAPEPNKGESRAQTVTKESAS